VTQAESEVVCFNLGPGDLHLARGPAILKTILGSCVGATFWCERLGAGGLSHGVLPRGPVDWPATSSVQAGFYYVDLSLRYLVRQFDALGARRAEIQVKLFGGADVLSIAGVNGKLTVGALNCQAAAQVLAEEGLRVLASDLRGTRGRKILFDTGTGEVLVQRLG
jgi:chemotaxis protein CheD